MRKSHRRCFLCIALPISIHHSLFTIYHSLPRGCLQSKGNMNGSRRRRYTPQSPRRLFVSVSSESHLRWFVPKRRSRCRLMPHHPPTPRAQNRCSCEWPKPELHRLAAHTHFVPPASSQVFLPIGQGVAPSQRLHQSFFQSHRRLTTKPQQPEHCNRLL